MKYLKTFESLFEIDKSKLLATLLYSNERESEGLIEYLKYKYPDIDFILSKDSKGKFVIYTGTILDDEKYKEVFQHLSNTGTTLVNKDNMYGLPK